MRLYCSPHSPLLRLRSSSHICLSHVRLNAGEFLIHMAIASVEGTRGSDPQHGTVVVHSTEAELFREPGRHAGHHPGRRGRCWQIRSCTHLAPEVTSAVFGNLLLLLLLFHVILFGAVHQTLVIAKSGYKGVLVYPVGVK